MSIALPGVSMTPVRSRSRMQNSSEEMGRSYLRSAVVPDFGLIHEINGSFSTQSESKARLVRVIAWLRARILSRFSSAMAAK
ncbi:hypothetical protein D9M72_612320 [compost metagenome]